jgi:hypothetical protein
MLSNTSVSAKTDREETRMNIGSTTTLAPPAAKPGGTVSDYLALTRFDRSTIQMVWSSTMSFCGED